MIYTVKELLDQLAYYPQDRVVILDESDRALPFRSGGPIVERSNGWLAINVVNERAKELEGVARGFDGDRELTADEVAEINHRDRENLQFETSSRDELPKR